ncbi:hypothetical protein BD410DRAFT_837166 [Rickenella mellea]|uniref:DEAD-box RNA helicase Q domain-containing protein n=1 Tax=Rickenella mellea TaxID=50990 RepID=A0A4Y7QEK1_9AGAM|nr:hypothetical protein BD410DRAFT_837166 [Rickenella mellea]
MERDADGFMSGPASKPESSDAKAASPVAGPSPTAVTDLIKSSFDVKVTLADQQADPDSPLYSVKSFDELGLHSDLLRGIYDMNFSKPSKIQERALPLLLRDPQVLL